MKMQGIVVNILNRLNYSKGCKDRKEIEIDAREMILQQNLAEGYNRLDIVVRYLAIEEYFGENQIGYDLYLKMQAKRKTQDTPEEINMRLERFKEIILDWKENGYDSRSKISCDCNLHLLDGSHRLALALYFGTLKMYCTCYGYEKKIDYSLNWFIEHGFSEEEIMQILNKESELLEKCMGGGLALVLWNTVSDKFDEITKELRWKGNVKKYIDYTFKEETYCRVVKGIYAIDDIDNWKVDRKAEAMRDRKSYKIRLIYFQPEQARYRIKNKNHKLISQEGEVIKKIFRERYKDSVEKYIHDIIIHTADNYEQSEYIFKLMTVNLDLPDYFKEIEKCAWMIIKGESDYMPDDFPLHFPFSKDLDIVCSHEDYEVVCKKTENYLKDKEAGLYNLKKIEEEHRCKYRFELRDFLILQFDISMHVAGIKDDFLMSSLERRIERDGVYYSEANDDICYRLNELRMFPHKKWHRKYVVQHCNGFKCDYIIQAFEDCLDMELLYKEVTGDI